MKVNTKKRSSALLLAAAAVLMTAVLILSGCPGADDDDTKGNKAGGTFTVTFNADGGTPAPADQTVADGGSVTAPAAMTRDGYTFGGWYKEAAFTTQWNFASDTVTANITLYAKWKQLRYEVTTLAGSTQGYADGTGTAAQFYAPSGVSVDADGSIYVADQTNHRIRKVTPAGVVTTLAGSGIQGFLDGTGTEAKFSHPQDVAVDVSGNIYVADFYTYRIRKVTPEGVVTTLAGSTSGYADGTGTAAKFDQLRGIAVGADGNIYVADSNNSRIRKVSPEGVVTTLAGGSGFGYADGTGTAATFKNPYGVAVGADGNIYVVDSDTHRVRKITPEGVVTTIAGGGPSGSDSGSYADGTGTAARFSNPRGVAVGADGNIYVADANNHRIRKVTPAGVVTTIAGSTSGYADGTGTEAKFSWPYGVAVDADGNIYVADAGNNRIRKIIPVSD